MEHDGVRDRFIVHGLEALNALVKLHRKIKVTPFVISLRDHDLEKGKRRSSDIYPSEDFRCDVDGYVAYLNYRKVIAFDSAFILLQFSKIGGVIGRKGPQSTIQKIGQTNIAFYSLRADIRDDNRVFLGRVKIDIDFGKIVSLTNSRATGRPLSVA